MTVSALQWGSEGARLLGAFAACLAYALLCVAIWRRAAVRRASARQAAAGLMSAANGDKPWIVAFASQTGTAERLAWQTAQSLHATGLPVRLCPLSSVGWADLASAERALLVLSTYGEGDPPDNASAFARLMDAPQPEGGGTLEALRFAVLTLGDSTYRNFCGFGRQVDQWLGERGATRLFERIDVDNHAADALARWHDALEQLGIASDEAAFDEAPFAPWRLAERRALNPDGTAPPVFELLLEPASGPIAPEAWEAGDIAQVRASRDPERPRDYSIASLPSEGVLRLLVRQERHPDGQLGLASGWLTESARLGSEVPLRLRPNGNFHAGANADRPLILVGNGTGLAGLRAHIAAREPAGSPPVWLVFGERQERHDFHWRDDIRRWQQQHIIERLDLAFSRDEMPKRYVQDVLRLQGARVLEWVHQRGAAIYVCGSLRGMAGGVHAALGEILGGDRLEDLAAEGRYRRDVY